MSENWFHLLKLHNYFLGVPDEILKEVMQQGEITTYETGTIVHEASEHLSSVCFVIAGRLKAVQVDVYGRESLFRIIERGEQYGMMVGALSEPVPVRIIAVEPSSIFVLDYERAMELTFQHQELRRLWLKTFAGGLRKFLFGTPVRQAPMVLGLMHETTTTRQISRQLIDRLQSLDENLAVFADSNEWESNPGIRFRSLYTEGRLLNREEINQQLLAWQDANRIILDFQADQDPERVAKLIEFANRVICFSPTSASESIIRRLKILNVPSRGWNEKINIAWIMKEKETVVPLVPNLRSYACRDFKIAESAPGFPFGKMLTFGLERLIHDLRGVRIGLALVGGAARGMSHLGVLKALEQNGIVVDMIAGTSAGAMTGILYGAGLDCDYCADSFTADLRPSWPFRLIPRGGQWYLLYKYRRRQFDPMLRKYLHDWKLEQLALPCFSITVDLVSGQSVVRESGDAVHAILESINLPVLSVPICRNDQALVDGGLVNNIPADVLVSMGCNFVIAVSVTARLEKQFCDITPGKVGLKAKPTIVQTLLRSLMVQSHSLNALGVNPADVVIEPDVTGIDLTEFTRARELAAIGEAAAGEQITKLQVLLNRLDPKLFKKP